MNKEISLVDLIKIAIKYIWVIVISMIVGIILAFYYNNNMVTPMYQSSSKYLVDTTNYSDEIEQGSTAQNEIQRITVLSRMVVSSYIEILDTNNFAEYLSEVLEEEGKLSSKYTGRQLRSLISFSFEEEKETYKVNVKASSPEDAYIIANAIQDHSLEYLVKQKPIAKETLKVIDSATIPSGPINVNPKLYMMLGAVGLAILAFVVCFIIEANDPRIKDKKTLKETFGLPIIGSIPELKSNGKE